MQRKRTAWSKCTVSSRKLTFHSIDQGQMISYQTGNIFESDAEALVNAVNCVGVMGKGLALQFKKYFPENYKDYSKACENNEVKPGQMLIFESESKLIINFPTKRHWRSKSRLEDIESGLVSL